MKTKTIITDITHDDLVNIFSTALYGSPRFGACYDMEKYGAMCQGQESAEDKYAHILLNGGAIEVFDTYAEGIEDAYGNGCVKMYYDHEDGMHYKVTLNDVKRGLERAIDGTFKHHDEEEVRWAHKVATNFMVDAGENDLWDADAILQIILFNEIIYG